MTKEQARAALQDKAFYQERQGHLVLRDVTLIKAYLAQLPKAVRLSQPLGYQAR